MKRAWFPYVLVVAGLAPFLAGTAPPAQPAPLQTAEEPLTIEVGAGFDGYFEQGNWLPLRVTLSNSGDDVQGELRAVVGQIGGEDVLYTRPIDLPSGSRKTVFLYVRPSGFIAQELEVELVRNNRPLTAARVDVQSVRQTDLLVGLLSNTPQALVTIGLVQPRDGQTVVALLQPENLPDLAEAWRGLDVLVVSDIDTGQISAAQRTALKTWVTQGGRLIVGGGTTYQRTLSGLIELSPVNASGVETVSLAPLGDLVREPFDAQAILTAPVAVGTVIAGAQVMVTSDDIPLLVHRRMGFGQVDFLAADLSLEPLRSWDSLDVLWYAILMQGTPRPAWGYGLGPKWDGGQSAVANIPGVTLPSVLPLCGFLGVYVLLIGPVNYFVLRRLKRRELAWFTIPALVLLFSAIAYVTGFQLRGSRVIVNRLTVVQAWDDSDIAKVDAIIGVWSPRRAFYDVILGDGYLVSPMPHNLGGGLSSVADITVEAGEVVALRDIRVDVGAVAPFVIEGYSADPPRLDADLQLTIGEHGAHLRGTVHNSSDVDLSQAVILFAGATRRIGDLSPGDTVEVDITVNKGRATPYTGDILSPPIGGYDYYYYGQTLTDIMGTADCYSPPKNRRRCDFLQTVLNGEGHGEGIYLAGWSEQTPVMIDIPNANAEIIDTALYFFDLPAAIEIESSEASSVLVPPGLMMWQIIDDHTSYPGTMPYELYLYGTESAAFRFEPLELVHVGAVESLVIHLERDYGDDQFMPEVALWNFQTQEWNVIQASWGDTLVDNARAYVDPAGGVEMRIRGDSDSYGYSITRFDVTLNGTR